MFIEIPEWPNYIIFTSLRVALEFSAHGEERMVEEAEFAETMETPLLGNKGSRLVVPSIKMWYAEI